MSNRSHIDASLLLAAFKSKNGMHEKAMEVIKDPDRQLIVSDAVWLEVMPKPLYHKQDYETNFYREIFNAAEYLKWDILSLQYAATLAMKFGIAAMDAIHIAFALDAKASELITAEKPDKPMFRAKREGSKVTSIRQESNVINSFL
jgi:predicted nucleic acid-binding protein